MSTRYRSVGWTPIAACLAAIVLAATPGALAGATIVVNSVDASGVGFNDPTPVEPVGGNPGTTLGEQRLIVFQFAADLWGSMLESDTEIVVQATFRPLFCAPNAAVLSSTGSTRGLANFPGAAYADTWYHPALANKLAGFDLTPGAPDPGLLEPPFNDDMFMVLNIAVDSDPICLDGRGWYYGLDNNAAPGVDLLNVMMHELAHGLGFANFIDESDGTGPAGLTDVYSMFTLDNTTGKHWNEMTESERVGSASNFGRVVWDGPHVRAQAPHALGPRPELEITAPQAIVGGLEVQPASFGPPLTLDGVQGEVLLANDGAGTTTDACEPLVGNYAGAIVLVDRGSCTFSTKTANAQAAGAVGVVVVNDRPTGLPPMAGDDPSIVIPSVGVSQADGGTVRAELPGVQAVLDLNPDLLAGVDDRNNVRLYADATSALGSAISHWDPVATPNLLLEPVNDSDIRAGETVDLTSRLLADVGWDECPDSDFSSLVAVEDCETGVANQVLDSGCTIVDLLSVCSEGSSRIDPFCVNETTNRLVRDGVLDQGDKSAIQRCTVQFRRPAEPPRGRPWTNGPPGRGRGRP
jgi:hypothetical protein